MSERIFQRLSCGLIQDVLIVTITDRRLDTTTLMDELRAELFQALEAHQGSHVVLNLRNVQMLQTLVLKTLVDLRKEVVRRNGYVVLCGLQPVVQEVLRITGFIDFNDASHGLFKAVSDVPAAIAQLHSPS